MRLFRNSIMRIPQIRPKSFKCMLNHIKPRLYPSLYSVYTAASASDERSRIVCDLRSDTVTTPTPAMLKAMMSSPVGDDVLEEDPSVNQLETYIAKITGKESALFCVSGTMSNQLAIRVHLRDPPYSVVCDERSHVYQYEAGGISFHSGAQVIPIIVPDENSFLSTDLIQEKWILDDDVHHAPTRLVCLENPMNGQIFPQKDILAIAELAKQNKVPLHCDGARLWNASIALGTDMKTLCEPFQTVSLCFSKGLGAPVGSILVGEKRLISRARHLRKLFGGGWRQAGVLAGTCLHALEYHWPRLDQDHRRAKKVSTSLERLGLTIKPTTETNMVWIDLKNTDLVADDVAVALRKNGILTYGGSSRQIRLVFHHQVTDEHVDHVISTFRDIFQAR